MTEDNLRADIADIQKFLTQTKSPRLQPLLETHLRKFEADLAKLQASAASDTAGASQSEAATSESTSSSSTRTEEEKPDNVGKRTTASAPTTPSELEWVNIGKFGWDQGEYNSPWVTIYVTEGLAGVGAVKKQVTCSFGDRSLDLKVNGLNGKNYRLLRTNLEKDIVIDECKFKVSTNRVTIKLKKVKGEYSYDHWTDLESKKPKAEAKKDDPMGGIMDLMKDMYDKGDDNMKKTIGEAMMKSRNGQGGMSDDMGMPDMKM